MQTLQLKFKNVPTDASQVCSSTSLSLNRNERASEGGIVLGCNNPDVNQQVAGPGLKVIKTVFVLSKEGYPLMPCTVTKARRLLKKEKAHVIKLNPFVIKLNFECENMIQEVSLGIDTGYKTIGFSAITNKQEVLAGELSLEDKTSKRLIDRSIYRRNRRNRLRYRAPRFNNRKKPKGWLPPSIQRRFDTHIRLIDIIKRYLPIKKVIVETAKFDIQKILNPNITGIEYQHGELYEYNNIREYLFCREKGKCQVCGKKINKGEKAHIHHIRQRKNSGANSLNNLTLLHEECHKKLHMDKLFDKLKPPKKYNAESFMSSIYKTFSKMQQYCITFGYITSLNRTQLYLDKTHVNDAFVIAGGRFQYRSKVVQIEEKRINNRGLQKNRKKFGISIRRMRYSLQNRDLVWINKNRYLCGGTASRGYSVYYFNGSLMHTSIKNIERVYHTNSLVWKY